MKKVISLNLDEEVIKQIDKKRNGIPRSPYINKILEEWLKGKKR